MHLHPRTRELLNTISPGSAEARLGDLVIRLIERVDALESAAATNAAPSTNSTATSTGGADSTTA